MSSSEQRIQVLYEISLSIGPGGDLTETARTALSAYLQKLNCSAGAVIERRRPDDGSVNYQTVTMIPSRAAVSEGFESALAQLPDDPTTEDDFQQSLPITTRTEAGTSYIMDLPGFGVLVLVTRGHELDGETVAALGPLNEKLATACQSERYEAQLREERDRFEAVFTTIEEPLVSVRAVDGELLVQRLNPAFADTFGHADADALGQPLSDLLGPTATEAETLPALDEHSRVTTEIRRETTDGMGEFLLRSAPINPDGDRTEHLVLLVDVTEEAAQQRRLEQLYDVTKVLARILRHNIRNDLTVIRARAERILADVDGAAARDARTILRKSEQLTSTAENAREMRELVATREEQSPIPLTGAISDAVNAVRVNYPSAEITVTGDVSDTVHPSLTTAIRHLVENGIEHHESQQDPTARASGEGGIPRVTVSAHTHPDGTRIEVRDNGPGIPQVEVEVLEQDTETDLKHGSGAGLWIVGKIVDYCDATIDFSVDNEGTTATITL